MDSAIRLLKGIGRLFNAPVHLDYNPMACQMHLPVVQYEPHDLIRPTTLFEEFCIDQIILDEISVESGTNDVVRDDEAAEPSDVLVVYSLTTSFLMAVAHMLLILSVLVPNARGTKLI